MIKDHLPKTKTQSPSVFSSIGPKGISVIKDLCLCVLYLTLFMIAFASRAQSTMTGEYTIGSTGADYLTIGEALTDYRSSTIAGDVTFLLFAETFDETVDLSFLPNGDYQFTLRGADREGTVLRSSSGGTLFEYWAGDRNGIIGMEESGNISLENFTIEGSSLDAAVYVANSEDLKLEAINFHGINEQSLYLARDSRVVVAECDFFADAEQSLIMHQGDSVFVQQNDFTNYSENGIFSLSTDHFFIEDNVMSSDFNSRHDIDMSTINDREGYVLSGNRIDGEVRAVAGKEVAIFNNIIKSEDEIAFGLSNSSREGKMLYYNNVFSSGSDLGVLISLIAFEHTSFINNTVISGGNPTGNSNFFAFENVLSDRTETFELLVLNNIFKGIGTEAVNFGVGRGVDSELVIDHNLLYSDIGEEVVALYFQIEDEIIDARAYTFDEWQTTFDGLLDQNSQSFEPTFEDDFRVVNAIDYRFGTFIDSLTTDIDGDLRPEGLVDVGADQYVCEVSVSSFEVTVFGQFVWDGAVYNESGSYTNEYVNTVGCDSTATLDLTILTPSFETEIAVLENHIEVLFEIEAYEGVAFTLGSDKDEELFMLADGVLSFASPPDFESPLDFDANNTYEIDIVATDDAANISSVQVAIVVTDADEIAPEITSEKVIFVEENIEGPFYTIVANEEATFELGAEKDEEWFALEGSELTFVSPPDFEVPFDESGDNDYFLDVIATDLAGNEGYLELIVSVSDVEELVLGTEEVTKAIYPNPVFDYLNIEVGSAKILKIFDQFGRKVKAVSLSEKRVNVSDLAPSIYTIQLIAESGEVIHHLKLVKN